MEKLEAIFDLYANSDQVKIKSTELLIETASRLTLDCSAEYKIEKAMDLIYESIKKINET